MMNSDDVLLLDEDLSATNLRRVWGSFATGVAVVTALDDGEPIGFTCQSLVSVSLDPPLLSFCPARTSTSWPRLRTVGALCVNILAHDQHDLCRAFARTGTDKFLDVEWDPTGNGSPAVRGAMAHIDATIIGEYDAGDHTIALARVTGVTSDEDQPPLLFFRGTFGGFAG
jgi:3-hydroxy-9,10-secoandrosta-1,3,5(10)-triene-9,17-dione monooxygenase reductase component